MIKRFILGMSLSLAFLACGSDGSGGGGGGSSSTGGGGSSSSCTVASGCANKSCACKTADGASLDSSKPCCDTSVDPTCTGLSACDTLCKVCK